MENLTQPNSDPAADAVSRRAWAYPGCVVLHTCSEGPTLHESYGTKSTSSSLYRRTRPTLQDLPSRTRWIRTAARQERHSADQRRISQHLSQLWPIPTQFNVLHGRSLNHRPCSCLSDQHSCMSYSRRRTGTGTRIEVNSTRKTRVEVDACQTRTLVFVILSRNHDEKLNVSLTNLPYFALPSVLRQQHQQFGTCRRFPETTTAMAVRFGHAPHQWRRPMP